MRIANFSSVNQRKSVKKEDISYSHLFDYFVDGVCIINEFGNIEYMNRAYEKIFHVNGFLQEGKSIFATKNDELILNAFRKKKNLKGKIRLCKGSMEIEGSVSPLYEGNQFKGVIAIYRKDDTKDEKTNILELPTSFNQWDFELDKPFGKIIGNSPSIKKALLRAQKASKILSTVLIRGESGTGKELVAKAIHENSQREAGPFVAINCGAIPSELLESELFGHEQGAFTGALKRKIGKFERANHGTVFLDEIGDLPMEMQVKLLRILQEKEFERIGGNEVIHVDIRIIAATNKNLEHMMDEGKFREDLYYRLNVIPIYLPPLRERKMDVPLLIEYFIKKISKNMEVDPVKLTKEAEACLAAYKWPGNIRELQNTVERIIALADEPLIDVEHIPRNISNIYKMYARDQESTGLINMNKKGALATLEEYEKEIIKMALNTFGSFNAAGNALGITHKTVASKARKYKIIENES
ncbi:sigma-54 interaction domain-containing protein [Crassaminicella profunda]|uniref:sigma-54 interaction domain-containing protein n=1 Tax=Crassaminicella profunda TaxID=1286698 RepID=UPI001CA73DA7|nr:sigma 54-interacting transcriptional regulator [Crassaminicella profunda]QZY53669.1 sigma 54-interacting transcriptional regulator [Crassaminicella profunda]